MEKLDRIFYIRAIAGAIAGIIVGSVLNPTIPMNMRYGIIILIGLMFYIISYVIAKKIVNNIKLEDKKKIVTNGIMPFIFLLLMFMILVYTGLHGNSR